MNTLRKQSTLPPLGTSSENSEVLVRAQNVHKKFCRSLKKSLWYGVKDIAHELNPLSYRDSVDGFQDAQVRPERQLRDGEFWAVNDVSFELRRGECLGLIGRNGAGKTTLLKMLNGLIKPDRGSIEMRGCVSALIALGAGFNPILTGRENVHVNASVLGLSRRDIGDKLDEIIDFAEIGDFIDSPVQSYSSGMQVRLGFAVATAMNPDVLILDEVLAVGDANFRSKCFQRIGAVLEKSAVIFVSHDAYQVHRICNEVMWLKDGRQRFKGDTQTGMRLYEQDDSNAQIHQSVLIAGDYISEVECQSKSVERAVVDGDTATDIEISITFKSSKNMNLGISMANIVAPGEIVVAQSVLNNILSPIQAGLNEWRFSLRDLHLAQGKYSVVLGFFESGNKTLALNLRHHIQFTVQGNLRYGPHYAIIATIE